MMRHRLLEHRFVRHLPEQLEDGVLYVSMDYATAAHACCCGCGSEVVTPFTPTDWSMSFNGEGVSLRPSVGNWNLPCRSHYVIDGDRVIKAGPWNDEQVAAKRERDKAAKAIFYGSDPGTPAVVTPVEPQPSWLRWFLGAIGRIFSR